MFFPFISLFIFAYTAVRLLYSLPLKRRNKLAVAGLMFFASLYHLISRYLLGSLASPELPAPVQTVQAWLYFAVILLFVILILRDLILICCLLARKAGLHICLPGSALSQAGIMTGLALALSAYGVQQALIPPRPRSLEIILPRLPVELDGFSIAHITDPHASALLRGPRMRVIADEVMAMKADLILLSGDLTDGGVAARRDDVAPMGSLKAAYGVYSCLGNHEYYSNYAEWMEYFDTLGIRMLKNNHVRLQVKGKDLVIAGTTDPASSRYGLPAPDAQAAFAGSPEKALRILLEHRPGSAWENAALGVDLQLSGHTHGGHIVGFTHVVALFNNGFVSGLYELGDMRLYVSNGAGLWNGFPVRLGVPSEVTRIVLRAEKKD